MSDRTNLFVGNLPFATTSADLKRLAEQYGRVEWARVIVNHDSGVSKGYGFIHCPTTTDRESILRGLDGAMVGGRKLSVRPAQGVRQVET